MVDALHIKNNFFVSQVYGWGNNRYGQVGTGGTGTYPRPTLITSLVNAEVVQIACGQFHSLAVTRDGRYFYLFPCYTFYTICRLFF